MPKDAPPPPVATKVPAKIAAKAIALVDDFFFRHAPMPDPAHVRALVQHLRAAGQLDPVLVWAEQDEAGTPTGRMVLLDGRHRLAAYRTVSRAGQGIPAQVLHGCRSAALLAAAGANTRETLPLTTQERMDAAWRLVRHTEGFTVPQTAKATGVSRRTVDTMRSRWAVMQKTGAEPTGRWWQDRRDAPSDWDGPPELGDRERAALVADKAKAIKDVLGKLPWRDLDLVADILAEAVGYKRHRQIAEYLHGEDGDGFDMAVDTDTGAEWESPSDDF